MYPYDLLFSTVVIQNHYILKKFVSTVYYNTIFITISLMVLNTIDVTYKKHLR